MALPIFISPDMPARRWCLVLTTAILVSACTQEGDSPSSYHPNPDSDGQAATNLNSTLRAELAKHGLSGDPAANQQLRQVLPSQDPKVKLGQLLFFSHTLSGDLSTSCATCHTPDLGGSDALSLGIGVFPEDAAQVGPARRLDSEKDLDPAADGKPNMHRNSQTIFNSALYNRSLTFDGRVFVLDEEVISGGKGQAIRTPESGNVFDNSGTESLLEVFSKFPLTNDNEMRAYRYSSLSNEEYREFLAKRLRGTAEPELIGTDAAERWLTLFRDAFREKGESASELITIANIQRALASYISSMIFVDTPWKRYAQGNDLAISDTAKQGALLFLLDIDKGGLGCASCHAGDFFTNEKFYNVGFPQIGRGFMRPEKDDIGRWNSTRIDDDKFAFRVPSLLNIELTAPYGHAGTFDQLDELLRYHAHPGSGLESYDFSLTNLAQFNQLESYDYAASNTRNLQEANSFQVAKRLLPNRELSANEIASLIAFLKTLTDECARDIACRNQWTPAPEEDPDGNLLVVGVNPAPNPEPEPGQEPDTGLPPTSPENYPKAIPLGLDFSGLDSFEDLSQCTTGPGSFAINAETESFVPRHDPLFGLYDILGSPLHPHGFISETWEVEKVWTIEPTMFAGGVSAAYLNNDCWLDLVYTGGDSSGVVFYINRGWQLGFDSVDLITDDPAGKYTGSAIADLNGDYRREILLSNMFQQKSIPIYSKNDSGNYDRKAEIVMSRYTYGISFGDTTRDGYPEIFMAHWSSGNSLTSPVFWKNNGGVEIENYDREAGLVDEALSESLHFSPQFADVDRDGLQDVLVAADFGTSLVLQGTQGAKFENKTDRLVIDDENGMGSALGDYDNDGDLDWFVTSIFDQDAVAEGNWGTSGNRLYRNNSSNGNIVFENVTTSAGVSDGNWGWGACFADFNNDGWLDIFHVNGFGNIPETIISSEKDAKIRDEYSAAARQFLQAPPRLFINNRNGTFEDRAHEWGMRNPVDGRGITCLDHDRDGDIDIAILEHSHGLRFYSNQTGHGLTRRFLSVRLVGEAPNTEALGATVQITGLVADSFPEQTQTRVVMANTNYSSQNPPDLHFGMGAALYATLSVTWPDQKAWLCHGVSTNRFIILDQREKPDTCETVQSLD